jgi:hypothetical protein
MDILWISWVLWISIGYP